VFLARGRAPSRACPERSRMVRAGAQLDTLAGHDASDCSGCRRASALRPNTSALAPELIGVPKPQRQLQHGTRNQTSCPVPHSERKYIPRRSSWRSANRRCPLPAAPEVVLEKERAPNRLSAANCRRNSAADERQSANSALSITYGPGRVARFGNVLGYSLQARPMMLA